MTPSRFQDPPRPSVTGASLKTGPPLASIFRRKRLAKKPMKRPSGDQNGRSAPSVPASGRAGPDSFSARTQSRFGSSPLWAVKTRREPSGEISTGPAKISVFTSSVPSGGRIDAWIAGAAGSPRFRRSAASPAATSARAPATSQPARAPRPRGATRASTAGLEPSAIQRSCLPTSPALCQRSSGSFARQVLTIRSRTAGEEGSTVETGGGSVCRIAPIRDAWLAPENALLPVAIS